MTWPLWNYKGIICIPEDIILLRLSNPKLRSLPEKFERTSY